MYCLHEDYKNGDYDNVRLENGNQMGDRIMDGHG